MTIGNVQISHQMIFMISNIEIGSILWLKLNGTMEVLDIWLECLHLKSFQSSIPERNDC